jgi:hypothetical protein
MLATSFKKVRDMNSHEHALYFYHKVGLIEKDYPEFREDPSMEKLVNSWYHSLCVKTRKELIALGCYSGYSWENVPPSRMSLEDHRTYVEVTLAYLDENPDIIGNETGFRQRLIHEYKMHLLREDVFENYADIPEQFPVSND